MRERLSINPFIVNGSKINHKLKIEGLENIRKVTTYKLLEIQHEVMQKEIINKTINLSFPYFTFTSKTNKRQSYFFHSCITNCLFLQDKFITKPFKLSASDTQPSFFSSKLLQATSTVYLCRL